MNSNYLDAYLIFYEENIYGFSNLEKREITENSKITFAF